MITGVNHARIFSGFRKVFGVRSYHMVDRLAGFDSGDVSRMRSGKRRISPKFFLACCIAADMSPVEMCRRLGITTDYFLPE